MPIPRSSKDWSYFTKEGKMHFSLVVIGLFVLSAYADDYAEKALQAHNRFRSIHNAGPLELDNEMSASALRYAEILTRSGFKHSNKKTQRVNPKNGENLIYRCSSHGDPLPAEKSVKDLYDEICMYNFNRPGFRSSTGHFTQIIWKPTTRLGVGIATSTKRRRGYTMNCKYVVFRYAKGGNVRNQFQQNAVRGRFRESYCDKVSRKDEPEQPLNDLEDQ